MQQIMTRREAKRMTTLEGVLPAPVKSDVSERQMYNAGFIITLTKSVFLCVTSIRTVVDAFRSDNLNKDRGTIRSDKDMQCTKHVKEREELRETWV